MNHDDAVGITLLLQKAAERDDSAKHKLYELVYDELRNAAGRLVRHERSADVQATALVHEVFLRFEKGNVFKNLKNRRVFFSVVMRAMKQVLIDQYRRRKKLVDSPDRKSHPLDEALQSIEQGSGFEFEALYEALEELEKNAPRQHAVIVHRFLGGLTIAQTAKLLEMSEGSVERDWRLARAKLRRRLVVRDDT